MILILIPPEADLSRILVHSQVCVSTAKRRCNRVYAVKRIVEGMNVSKTDLLPIFQAEGGAQMQVVLSHRGGQQIEECLRPSYTESYDLNVQHSFTQSVIAQLGYVGTKGTHLLGLFNINPAAVGTAGLAIPNLTRPYYSQFPNFRVIDEARSNLGSNYNSLQTSLRIQNYHRLTSQFAY